MSIINRARPEIRALKPYASARSSGQRLPVLLNANENPWPVPGLSGPPLNRYPDPQPPELLEAMAERYHVPADQLLVTRGSDEAIDLLVRAFCQAYRDTLIYCPPTFGMYRVAAQIQGAGIKEVPLEASRQYALDAAGVIAAIDESVRLVFLCSPNNPTGALMQPDEVREVVEACRDKALVVVDEAYLEFARVPSLAADIHRYDNLAVLRTLSKAYGLAGARCGALIARPGVVDLLRRTLPPYPLSSPTIEAAVGVLAPDRLPEIEAQISRILAGRDELTHRLARYRFVRQVLPSDANFLLVRVDDANALAQAAATAGIALRSMRHQAGLQQCVRISVGTPAEMARLYELLAEFDAEPGS